MMERYVFLSGRAEPLYHQDQVEVLETYNFGEGVGSAARIAFDNEEDLEVVKNEVSDAVGIEEDLGEEFGLRNMGILASENVATIEDVKRLHKIPDGGATGDGVHVVVMDSGIDGGHSLFADKDINHVDVTGRGTKDEVGHGTACAGQIVRIAPGVKLTSLRIFGNSGRTSFDTILRAYEWLFQHANEVDIVNMSWGAQRKVSQIDRLQNKLVEKGVRDVTAAGNTGDTGGSPATAERAFSAGACTEDGRMAPFSSYNPNHDNPDVSAIGVNNRLAQARGTTMGEDLSGPWVMASGTSFAAPELAGSVARYAEDRGTEGIVAPYEENADDIKGIQKDGAGLLNHRATVRSEPAEPAPPQANATVWTLWADMQDIIYIGKNWLKDGEYRVYKQEQEEGRVVLELRKK